MAVLKKCGFGVPVWIMIRSRTVTLLLAVGLCLSFLAPLARAKELSSIISSLVKKIPLRRNSAMTGSEFARYVSRMDQSEREEAIETELVQGNIPDFLRKLHPIELSGRTQDDKKVNATLFVLPDYLA